MYNEMIIGITSGIAAGTISILIYFLALRSTKSKEFLMRQINETEKDTKIDMNIESVKNTVTVLTNTVAVDSNRITKLENISVTNSEDLNEIKGDIKDLIKIINRFLLEHERLIAQHEELHQTKFRKSNE